ncbi:MAG: glycosyltransferase family 4 protein [Bacteroides sp.]|nr:glycosyltransferase family 4 protein [Bacteroides sp.]
MDLETKGISVLFVTLHYLDGVGGGVFASRAYINAFTEICKERNVVTLLYPASETHGIDGIDDRVKAIPVYDNASRLKKGLNLLQGKVHRNFDEFRELLQAQHFDLVVFDNSRVSFRMIDLAHQYGAKVITIHHNCELEYNRDNLSGILKPIMLHWTKRYEEEALKKSDLNLTLTPEDRDLFLQRYDLPSNISDRIKVCGVFESKESELSPIKREIDKLSTFVITGNLGARQSNLSILKWINTYYPILKINFPKTKLIIAGKNPSPELFELCQKSGIELIPSPESMQPILNQADCYICPTELGGGLKLRIMDGLKNGLPVITHKVSARGYHDFLANNIVQSYSNAEEFSKICKSFSGNEYNRKNIQQKYHAIFSFSTGVSRLSKICSSLLKRT